MMGKCVQALQLLIGYKKKFLKQMDKTILLLQEKLKSSSTPDSWNKFEDQLDKDYKKWEKEIQDLKIFVF